MWMDLFCQIRFLSRDLLKWTLSSLSPVLKPAFLCKIQNTFNFMKLRNITTEPGNFLECLDFPEFVLDNDGGVSSLAPASAMAQDDVFHVSLIWRHVPDGLMRMLVWWDADWRRVKMYHNPSSVLPTHLSAQLILNMENISFQASKHSTSSVMKSFKQTSFSHLVVNCKMTHLDYGTGWCYW